MLETLTSALIVATTCLPFIPMAEVSVRQERTETTSDSEPVVAPVPALGAFDQELNGIRQGEQAMLLPGGAGTVVLSSGRSITVLDPTVEGEVTRERSVSGAFTAVCIRPNGDLVAFEEVLGELRVWSPSLDGPVLREVARVKLDQSRTETLVDVVDMTPFQDGYLLNAFVSAEKAGAMGRFSFPVRSPSMPKTASTSWIPTTTEFNGSLPRVTSTWHGGAEVRSPACSPRPRESTWWVNDST
jgi:hypothetical protein